MVFKRNVTSTPDCLCSDRIRLGTPVRTIVVQGSSMGSYVLLWGKRKFLNNQEKQICVLMDFYFVHRR
jgi:hypothetical protein